MKDLHSVPLSPGLYLVATPIGNLRDISLRALDALNGADMIVCEDTRVTGKLLQAFDIKKPLVSYNDHNAGQKRGGLLEKLAGGARLALVSDAGTPLVSDPGFKLVRDCLDLGLPVTSVPGANAPLTALQLSGLPSDSFSFIGFLPPKSAARRSALIVWKDAPGSLIAFETASRLLASLEDMREVLGDRPAAVVREITKKFEESRRGMLSGLIAHYREEGPPKGEIVVVIGAAEDTGADEAAVEGMLREALKTMSVRDAADYVAAASGWPRRKVYEMALSAGKDGDD